MSNASIKCKSLAKKEKAKKREKKKKKKLRGHIISPHNIQTKIIVI